MQKVKEVFAPHLNRNVKLGRKRPIARCPRMHMRDYMKRKAMPPVPLSVDYSPPGIAALRNIYNNDTLGDCVIAMGYHIVGLETGFANNGAPFVASKDQIIADYAAIGGYNPADPSTDRGCDEQTALNYWTQTGFANGTKLCGWLAVDATDSNQVQTAMYLFENLCFGLELPDTWINPFPSGDGFVWAPGAPDPANGHAVCGVGYDSLGIQIDTWGLIGTMTYAAMAALCDSKANTGGELYVLLSPDQVAAGMSKAPNGFDWAALVADFDSLGGNVPLPGPAPQPFPIPPAPIPQPAPQTLEEAVLAWAKGHG